MTATLMTGFDSSVFSIIMRQQEYGTGTVVSYQEMIPTLPIRSFKGSSQRGCRLIKPGEIAPIS